MDRVAPMLWERGKERKDVGKKIKTGKGQRKRGVQSVFSVWGGSVLPGLPRSSVLKR